MTQHEEKIVEETFIHLLFYLVSVYTSINTKHPSLQKGKTGFCCLATEFVCR